MNKMVSFIIGIIVFFIIIVVLFCFETVPAGYVGVVYNINGGVQKEVLSQGLKFVSPLSKVSKYSIATEQAYLSRDSKEGGRDDDSFLIPTKDGKTVNVDFEYSYRFDVNKVSEIYTKFRGQDGKIIEDSFMRGKVKTYIGEVSSNFSVIEIYGEKRTELNKQIFEKVKEKFSVYGIIIESANISRIQLDEQTSNAIQAKINAQQLLEQTKIEKQQAEILAQKQVAEAKGRADSKVIEAEGNAKAYAVMNTEINEGILRKMWIEKWDGKLPTTTTSDNSGMMYNIK